MNSKNELYENGLWSGEENYTRNIATDRLNSDNTGMWLIGNLPKNRDRREVYGFIIEVFNSETSSYDYNKNVLDNSDLLSSSFSNTARLRFVNCFVAEVKVEFTEIRGVIKLEEIDHNGVYHVIRTFRRATLRNDKTVFYDNKPINEVLGFKYTMDSKEIFKIRTDFEEISPLEDLREEVRPKRTLSVLAKLFQSS